MIIRSTNWCVFRIQYRKIPTSRTMHVENRPLKQGFYPLHKYFLKYLKYCTIHFDSKDILYITMLRFVVEQILCL